MLIIIIAFIVISLILTYIINIKDKNKKKKINIDSKNIILNILIYLAVGYFLSNFYSFNPLEEDTNMGIIINPYVAFISLILQYLNVLLINDNWIKNIEEIKNNKLYSYLFTIIYNITVTIGLYLLYVGYTGTKEIPIYSPIPIFQEFSIITLFIPYLIYNINLIKIIKKKKSDKS